MRIQGTRLASGPITGTPVGGWYRYGGDKPLGSDGDRQLPGCVARTARREKRIAEFAAVLADLGEADPWKAGNPAVIEAGKRVGVGRKTAIGYRTELRKRQQQDSEVHP